MKNIVFNCNCGSQDLQTITIKIRLLIHPNTLDLRGLYRELGIDYDKKVLESLVFEICGTVLAQYNASQIISQRDSISLGMRQRMLERAKIFNIIVDDFAIIDINFSKEFTEAIEKKQVAQQDAESMKYVVEQALEDKKSTILKAEGESTSVKKFGEANKINTAFLELRKIEASRQISHILKTSHNKIILDANSLYLNLPNLLEMKGKRDIDKLI